MKGEITGVDVVPIPSPYDDEPCKHETIVWMETKPASCEDYGYGQYVCGDCGEVSSEEITPPTGHSWVENVIRMETCTEPGIKKYTCERCGKTITEEIPATGHNWADMDIEPTCTEPGHGIATCTNCGLVNVDDNDIPPLGHELKVGRTLVPVSCSQEGLYEMICTRCDYRELRTIPKSDHPVWDIEGRHIQKGEYDMKTGECIKPSIIEIRCLKCGGVAKRLVMDDNLYKF